MIRHLNVEIKAEEIHNLYNAEKATTDDLYAKVREIIGRNQQTIIATRRGPVIGMRSMAINQGLKQEQILKFFKFLTFLFNFFILCYYFERITNSVLLFKDLPSSVELSAIGTVSP